MLTILTLCKSEENERIILSKFRAKAIIAILAVGLTGVVLTGCTESSSVNSAPTATDKTDVVNREASLVTNRIRSCVQNLTNRNLDYRFSEVRNDQDEPLSPSQGTLGPGAFICAVSKNYIYAESLIFYFTGTEGYETQIKLINSTSFILTYKDMRERDSTASGIAPGEPWWFYSGGLRVDVSVDGQLRQVGKVKAYPFDVRISDIN